MQYKEFKDGIKLSRLGMGNMRLPVIGGKDRDVDYEKMKKIIDRCMEGGVNYYDTAYIYHGGNSERCLGRALAQYPRESYYVADKFYLYANPDCKAQLEDQLQRLGMDYIDFYLMHGIQDDFIDDILERVPLFDEMKRQGKIRYLGFSYHGSPSQLPRILARYDWDFAQIQLNYYDWYFGDAKELYEILAAANIPVMVMEPVHGGLLANLTEEAAALLKGLSAEKSLASWAMRWVMEHEGVQVILSGMSDTEQLQDNLETFQQALPLSAHEQEQIEKAARIQRSAVAVACTGCRYCCTDCPKGLDIPRLLKVYNDAKLGGSWRLSTLGGLPEDKRPTACIQCGACTKHCPQSFEIPKYMQEMAKELRKMNY